MSSNNAAALTPLLELSAKIGSNPLLTQASTGNASMKLDGRLWIKATGKWMADATRDDFLIPLDLGEVNQCVKKMFDPAERYRNASIETAMHAVLPHRVVLHVHSVNTIAWAVRQDALLQLGDQLDGLPWQWIPYVPSGLPLACEIEKALSKSPSAQVFVLGNHGLVIGGDDCSAVEGLLAEVERRLTVPPREAHPADYAALTQMANGSSWDLPDDDEVHALGTDSISRRILSGGLLYPCQMIFSTASLPALFRAIACFDSKDQWESEYGTRPFVIVEGRGVLINETTPPTELATISGLAQVVQRITASAPIRYLTEAEVMNISKTTADRYRELAGTAH
jgi:rhamnose utilization protein RhaD (predicted bifunctional aldolase and dehydrogenase)